MLFISGSIERELVFNMMTMERLTSYVLRAMGYDQIDGKTVTYHNSLTLPPVWYALTKVCGDVGKLPLDIKKVVGQGAENDLDHYGYRLFREQPNKVQTPAVFKEQIIGHAIMYGNARAAIIRKGSDVLELIPMLPDRSYTFLAAGEKYHVTYPTKDSRTEMFSDFDTEKGNYILFRDEDVLHIPGFSFNGVEGIGLLDIAQGTFGIGIGSQKHLRTQISKGFSGKTILKVPIGQLNDESKAKEFLEQFNKNEGGSDNAGKAAMLRGGIDIVSLGQSNTEAQMVELQKFNRQDVGLLFGIDAMPGDGETSSYNSEEQENLRYLSNLDRILVKLEEECDRKLRTRRQKAERTHFYKFNRGSLYRTDLATTTASLSTLISACVINANEARAKLDMNPYDGGDVYKNPAITVTDPPEGRGSNEQSDDKLDSNRLAMRAMLLNLVKVEAKRVETMASKQDFLAKAERFYQTWEPKLAAKLLELGLDGSQAKVHCDESKAELVDILSQTEPQNVYKTVQNAVEKWENRLERLVK